MDVPRMMENRDSREGEQKGGEEGLKKKKKPENSKQFKRRHMSTMLQTNHRITEK